MGFRFRKSVKLAPGLRVNFGKRGASLSVGGRGLTTNISSRGTRTTVSIPGTGMSWSSSSSGRSRSRSSSVRRPSQRQIEAAERRAAVEAARMAAEVEIAREDSRYTDILNTWRNLPLIPDRSEYEAWLSPVPFQPDPPPEQPIEKSEKKSWSRAIRSEIKKSLPSVALIPTVVSVSLLGLSLHFQTQLGEGLAAVMLLIGLATMPIFGGWRLVRRWKTARARVAAEWPDAWAQKLESHARAVEKHQEDAAHQREEWDKEEQRRIASLRKLLDGDLESLNEALADALSDLDFPFETLCSVAASDEAHAYILLDLPEIEDVIPETKKSVLKNGTIKEKKRTKAERAADYASLTTGLSLFMSCAAFAAGPTLGSVSVAAYTQRRQARTGVVRDEFVYEAYFDRAAASRFKGNSVDPVSLIAKSSGRIDMRSSGELKMIDPPEWRREFE